MPGHKTGAAPYVLLGTTPKVIVWLVCAIAETVRLPARSIDTTNRARMTADRATQLARTAKIPPLATARVIECGQQCAEISLAKSA